MNESFCAVVVPADDQAYLITYESLSDLIDALRSFVGNDVQVFPYVGKSMHISKGSGHKYLLYDKDAFPLFKQPVSTRDADPFGGLGDGTK